jgi:hypothetical protein
MPLSVSHLLHDTTWVETQPQLSVMLSLSYFYCVSIILSIKTHSPNTYSIIWLLLCSQERQLAQENLHRT